MLKVILSSVLLFVILIFGIGLIAGTMNDDEDKSK